MRAVLERDFLAEASRPRAFRARTYLGLLVALAVTVVLTVSRDDLLLAPDKVAVQVFRTGSAVLVLLLALLAPAAVVGAVIGERIQETLPLVLASPVGPLRFALAKILSRAAVVLGWGLAALLPLGMTVLLGGVSGAAVLGLVGLAAGVVIDLAAWGLWVSCATRRPATAIVLSYLLPAGRWAGCVVGGVILGWWRAGPVAGFLVATTPLPAWLDLADPGQGTRWIASLVLPRTPFIRAGTPAAPTTMGWDPILVFLAVAVAWAALSIWLTARRLRDESEPPGPPPRLFLARLRGLRLFPLHGRTDPYHPRHHPPAGNPMAWKEGRLLSTAASRPLYYALLLVLSVVEIVHQKNAIGNRMPTGAYHFWEAQSCIWLFSFYGVLLSLVAALIAASSIAYERNQGTWDLLRASPLTAGQILRGKVLGILRGVTFLALLPIAHLWIGLETGALAHPGTAAVGTLLLLDLFLFWTVVGLLCGASTRNPGKALFVTVLVFAGFLLGLPFLRWLLDGLWWRLWAGGGPGTALGSGGPWAMVSQVLLGMEFPADIGGHFQRYAFGRYRFVDTSDLWVLPARWAAGWAFALLAASVFLFRVLEGRIATDAADRGGRS